MGVQTDIALISYMISAQGITRTADPGGVPQLTTSDALISYELCGRRSAISRDTRVASYAQMQPSKLLQLTDNFINFMA